MPSCHLAKEGEESAWNEFVSSGSFALGSFLQSWQWGEFQKKTGKKAWRLTVREQGCAKMAAQAIKLSLPFGQSLLYVPHGPVGPFERVAFEALLGGLSSLAQEEKCLFLRLDPPWLKDAPEATQLASLGFKKAHKDIQPSQTLLVDLEPEEEQVILGFKPKTRYNVRLAQRHGVTVGEVPLGDARMGDFLELLAETAQRDGFYLHPPSYYEDMMSVLGPDKAVRLFVATGKDGQAVSGALVDFWQGVATYLHGASRHSARQLMSPYALHWEIMRRCRQEGFRHYDLNGISQEGDHKGWEGITRFKRGFAPQADLVLTAGTWELPYQAWPYRAYRLRGRLIHR